MLFGRKLGRNIKVKWAESRRRWLWMRKQVATKLPISAPRWLRSKHILAWLKMENICGGSNMNQNNRPLLFRLHLTKQSTQIATNWDSSIVYVDRCSLECPGRTFWSNWKLTPEGCSGGHQRLTYTCCEAVDFCKPTSMLGYWIPLGYTSGEQNVWI